MRNLLPKNLLMNKILIQISLISIISVFLVLFSTEKTLAQDTLWKRNEKGERIFEIYRGELYHGEQYDLPPKRRFIPHIDFGFNALLGNASGNYTLNTLRSQYFAVSGNWRFKILGDSSRLGIQVGLELAWLGFGFSGDNFVTKGANGVAFSNNGFDLSKNKLSNFQINIPILAHFQWQKSASNTFNLAAGVYVGMRAASYTKIHFKDGNGDFQKIKNADDFFINPFRFGLTGQVGGKIGRIFVGHIFVKYDVSQFFRDDKANKINAFTFGIRI